MRSGETVNTLILDIYSQCQVCMLRSFVGADVGCFRQHPTFLPKQGKVLEIRSWGIETECSSV